MLPTSTRHRCAQCSRCWIPCMMWTSFCFRRCPTKGQLFNFSDLPRHLIVEGAALMGSSSSSDYHKRKWVRYTLRHRAETRGTGVSVQVTVSQHTSVLSLPHLPPFKTGNAASIAALQERPSHSEQHLCVHVIRCSCKRVRGNRIPVQAWG